MLKVNNNSSEALLRRNEDLGLSQSVYKIDTKFLEQVALNPSIKDLASDVDKSDGLVAISKIYHKLCKVLRYDQAAFASLSNGAKLIREVDKHRGSGFISQVSIDKNEVICNDFSAIFAKLALSIFPDVSLFVKETYTGMPNGIMHVSSIIECTDVGYLEVDPLASFTRSDFLRARLGLSLMGLRIENVSIPPDDTYHKYHNWNDLCNLDKLLETIQEDIQSFKLPTVEAASFAKGALRAAIDKSGYKVRVSSCEHGNNLVSAYTLTSLSGEEISKISLNEGALKIFN